MFRPVSANKKSSNKTNKIVIGTGEPLLVIAGPCAAESVELCLEVAESLQEACAKAGANYVFKASYDKVNRSSHQSERGPGMDAGLKILETVRNQLNVPVITDIHQPEQAQHVAQVCDILQIPAFLCRQSDLIEAAASTGLPLNIKKGQFLAPEDMVNVATKAKAAGAKQVFLCERGTSFGYHNLVVDMRGLVIMAQTSLPIVFDATHSTQLPGVAGKSSGGQRQMAWPLARAAIAVGIDGLFIESHPNPAKAISDKQTQLPLKDAIKLIQAAADLHRFCQQNRLDLSE